MRDLKVNKDESQFQYCHLAPDVEVALLSLHKQMNLTRKMVFTSKVTGKEDDLDEELIDKLGKEMDCCLNLLANFTLPNAPQPFHVPAEFKRKYPQLPDDQQVAKMLPALSSKQKSSVEAAIKSLISSYSHNIELLRQEKETLEAELSRVQLSYKGYVRLMRVI